MNRHHTEEQLVEAVRAGELNNRSMETLLITSCYGGQNKLVHALLDAGVTRRVEVLHAYVGDPNLKKRMREIANG